MIDLCFMGVRRISGKVPMGVTTVNVYDCLIQKDKEEDDEVDDNDDDE